MGGTRAAWALGAVWVGVLSCWSAAAQEHTRRTALLPAAPQRATPVSVRATPGEAHMPSIEVRLTSQAAFAPAYVRGLVRVAPHPDNRTLRVEVDSPAFYRSSDVTLDGERAARNHFFSWPSLPSGAYRVVVTVLGADGDPRAARHVPLTVLGPGMDAAP